MENDWTGLAIVIIIGLSLTIIISESLGLTDWFVEAMSNYIVWK